MENYQGISKYRRIKDSFDRVHNYLRLSLTDRCNLRCNYCMPSNPKFLSQSKLLSANEIKTLVAVFTELGVNKIRLTGGEPLLRKDFAEIISEIAPFNTSLHITTNGYLLDKHIDLISTKFASINISLDSLKPDRYKLISQKDHFHKVWNNIDLALTKKIHTKLNVVVIRNINHDEVIDFARLTLKHPLEIRFIEFMPFKGNQWDISQTYRSQEMLRDIQNVYKTDFLGRSFQETAEKYKIRGSAGTFGFISTVSHPFCNQCNRIRITADGKLSNCLFSTDDFDLLPLLDNSAKLKLEIFRAFSQKHFSKGGYNSLSEICSNNILKENRCMTSIGG